MLPQDCAVPVSLFSAEESWGSQFLSLGTKPTSTFFQLREQASIAARKPGKHEIAAGGIETLAPRPEEIVIFRVIL